MTQEVQQYLQDQFYKRYAASVYKYRKEYSALVEAGQVPPCSEDDYIQSQILEEVNNSGTSAENGVHTMRELAAMFTLRNNPDLWQDHYPTGFPQLDEALGGGFTVGLHVVGAVSSLGKSTLVLQIADNLTAAGYHVIFVSLEMAPVNLASKLISRQTYIDAGRNLRMAKTSRQLTGEASKDFDEDEWEACQTAANTVMNRLGELKVLDSAKRRITVDDIEREVERHIRLTGERPVLVVDYLQILPAPRNSKFFTDKQVVDYNVARFRAIANAHDIPIIIISSFNRSSYDTQASLQAFKDSGNIEYSADTLIGLQAFGIGKPNFDPDKAKAAIPRQIELVILKQRYGPVGQSIRYEFLPQYNHFTEKSTYVKNKTVNMPIRGVAQLSFDLESD